MNWLKDKIEERIKQYEFENDKIYYDENRQQRLLEAREMLSLIDQAKCDNCQYEKVCVIKKQSVIPFKGLNIIYCSKFEAKK